MSKIKKWSDPTNKTSIPHLYIDEEKGEFWVVKRINGSPKKKNLKTTNLNVAKSKMFRALGDLGDAKLKEKATTKLLKDFHENYMDRKKNVKGLRTSTIIRNESAWRNSLEPFFGNLVPSQITPKKIDDFITWHKTYKPGVRVFNPIRYLNGLLNYLIRIGELTSVQAPKIEMPKDEVVNYNRKKGRVITWEELDLLCLSSNDYLKLMINIAYRVGMRKMEIASLQKEKIIETHGRLFMKLDEDDTKTGIARTIPVPMELVEAFKSQIKTAKGGYVFGNSKGGFKSSQVIDRDWSKAKKDSGITGKMRFHDLRHTCATNFARMKVNPMMAVTLLGMSLRTYQKTYLNLSAQDLIEVADLSYGEHKNDEQKISVSSQMLQKENSKPTKPLSYKENN